MFGVCGDAYQFRNYLLSLVEETNSSIEKHANLSVPQATAIYVTVNTKALKLICVFHWILAKSL